MKMTKLTIQSTPLFRVLAHQKMRINFYRFLKLCFMLIFALQLGILEAQYNTCNVQGDSNANQARMQSCSRFDADLNEILTFPDAEFKLVFHFQANSSGQNFTCDPNDPILSLPGVSPDLYAPQFINNVIQEMNLRMSKAVLLDYSAPLTGIDAKINFSKLDPVDCNSFYFYEDGEQINHIPGALNIRFINTISSAGGWTYYGGNTIFMNNNLAKGLNGTLKWWDVARLINHEFGHTQYLKHAFHCTNPCDGIDLVAANECDPGCVNGNPGPNDDCWGKSENNLMMSYGTQLHFTVCEFEEMWNYIINTQKDFMHFDFCDESLTTVDLEFDVDETWESKKVFKQNVIIKAGTEITVKCDVLMDLDKQIILEENAKLIVDGGRITNLCPDDTWRGIRVYGGNSDFDVKFTNEAIIENTSKAAVSMFAPLPWPQIQNYGNGILHAENTTFNNVSRIAELISWSALPNASYVRHCVQNGGKWGVTNWNCLGVEISDNDFTVDKHCIVTTRGSFNIYGNTFHSGENDILFLNPSIGFGSDIQDNSFQGNVTGFRGVGASFGENTIKNNQFLTDNYDIFMDGDNSYEIKRNTSSADYGVLSISNGDHSNSISSNEFNGNYVGIMPTGYNGKYNFYENCYTTSSHDAYVEGKIGEVILNNNSSNAGNCFTHGATIDIEGVFEPFTYVEPDDNIDNCFDIHSLNSDINIIPLDDAPTLSCGATGFPSIPAHYSPCFPQGTKIATKQAIFWLTSKINEIESDSSLSEATRRRLLYIYKRCLKRVKWALAKYHLEDGEYLEAKQIFTGNNSDDAYVAIYSIYLIENDLTGALQYLNGITSQTEQMLDFKATQMVNLERLHNGPFYAMPQNKLDIVKTIAEKSHPYAAYAKSLYYILTEELLSSELPTIFSNKNQQKYLPNGTSTSTNVDIYPNPFATVLNIDVSGYNDVSIEVFDIMGNKLVDKSKVNQSNKIETDTWQSGIYFINIYSEGVLVHNSKVSLIK